MKQHFSSLLGILVLLTLLSGCRYGLPPEEASNMHDLQQNWTQMLETAENKYVAIAEQHNKFMTAVQDTSNHYRSALIQQDTLLRLQIRRMGADFERVSRRHLFQLKELRSSLEANDIWLMRISTEGAARRAIRGSWEARSTQFKTKFARITASESEFVIFGPAYEKLSKRIPGMGIVAVEPVGN